MATELAEERETLRHLMRTDPDPCVRPRAHALLLVADGQTVTVARLFGTAGHRDADGRRSWASCISPSSSRRWSIRDLQALVQRERGIIVSVDTLHRAVQALGYRYRRPHHDVRHRQDAEAVAAAKRLPSQS